MDNLVNDRIAIIPARGGSKRIPGKNIMDFNGKPMIAWTIEATLETGLFDEVIVSTDSEEIAAISRDYGASVPFLRKENADDYSEVSKATISTLNQLKEFNGKEYQTVVQLMANCPLRTSKNISDQIRHFEAQITRFSVLSGLRYGMFNPWWAHFENPDGSFSKLHDNMSKFTRSQDLPELICPTGATWISERNNLIESGSFYSKGYKFFLLNWKEAIDIDDYEDFELAQTASKLTINQ